MSVKNKIYFASDFHLGVPSQAESLKREKLVVQWLNMVSKDASEIYLMGDLFDFWFEYKHAVPKGHVRLLGTIASLVDNGISVHFFTGNHDMWMYDYFPLELGVTIHKKPIIKTFGGKKFYLGHGDGLGPGDKGYKFIKKVFSNKICQWLFARLHPNFGIGMARFWSQTSRNHTGNDDDKFLGEDQEWLVQYCKELLQKETYDYFIFGHRHLPLDIQLNENSKYINLGDWLKYNTYAEFDGQKLELKKFGDQL